MLDVEFAELSDRGRTREHNEDALGHVAPTLPTQSHGWLFAIADGLGGQDSGEVASQIAIDTVVAGFRKIPKGVMHVSLLPRLVQEANLAVYDAGQLALRQASADGLGAGEGGGSGDGSRMGTTLVACALRFDSAVISHVGDSRCYLFREGVGVQLTRDHTMAAEQFRLGLLSQVEASTGDNRHILTRSLGAELFVAADTVTVNIIPGDLLLLCSDGLHGYVTDERMQRLVNSTSDLETVTIRLVEEANEAGGYDNVSVQLIRVRSVERMGLYRGRPYRLL
jgi:serine/threonine protein phosphatase PrpC